MQTEAVYAREPKAEDYAALDRVRGEPLFVSFVTILDGRAQGGRRLSALRMLTALGLPAKDAWDLLERWPRRIPPGMRDLGMKLLWWRAIYLARRLEGSIYPEGIDFHDWERLIDEALEASED